MMTPDISFQLPCCVFQILFLMNVSNAYSYDILFLDTLYSTKEGVNLQNNSFVFFFFSLERENRNSCSLLWSKVCCCYCCLYFAFGVFFFFWHEMGSVNSVIGT